MSVAVVAPIAASIAVRQASMPMPVVVILALVVFWMVCVTFYDSWKNIK